MPDFIRLIGPQQAVELFGVRLVGVNADNGKKLLFTLVFVAAVLLLNRLLRRAMRRPGRERAAFWTRQGIALGTAVLLLVGLLSIYDMAQKVHYAVLAFDAS